MKRLLLTGSLSALCLCGYAQQKLPAILSGRITAGESESLPGATIALKGHHRGTTSAENGRYRLEKIPAGTYTVLFSHVGYRTVQQAIRLKNGEEARLDIRLEPVSRDLDAVSVTGRTETREAARQAYNITAIDAKPLHNTTQDLNQVLGKSAGVRIREDGGLGSSFNFSLNGFSGNQVKFFLDGIPMDNFGSSLTLNNIPVNLADRIEVYKGVTPIWLGADALGGAVNIITNKKTRNYLDVSYSYGSFNTHRTAVTGAYTHAKSGFTVLANLFQNYSDNNYRVHTGVTDLVTSVIGPEQRLRRFHDNYRSETMQAEAGFTGKKFADRLLIGLVLSQNRKEIQTAAQMSKVYGGWYQTSTTVMPTFKYQKKDLFLKGLDLNAYGSYNLGHTQNVDTLNRVYNWAGEYKDNSRNEAGQYVPGGENSRSLYRFRNHSGIATVGANYAPGDRQSIGLNYVFTTFDRKGSDVLRPLEESYQQPQILRKHVLGLGYKLDYNDRWSTSLFVKQFIVRGEATQRVDIYTNPRWVPVFNNKSSTGFGLATTYFIADPLQLKFSYEKTFRLPEGDELFGDGINHVANRNLRPEKSHNLNLGAMLNRRFGQRHKLSVEANLIYREASDFIRVDLADNRTQSVNVRGVRNTGFDADIRYSFLDGFTAGANATYQYLINTTKYETETSKVVSAIYKDQIPNIPYLFGNANLGFQTKKAGPEGSRFGLTYHVNYVAPYYLKWPSLGYRSDKNEIPQQLSHDLSATYSLRNGRYNVSAECRNLTDARLYDNFLMQKPGRAFYLKVRYFIHKL
ncbi:TonB-dependent receptor [Siphonobacter aquaeclarae]|uniref:Outer membrane receptor proteins, mostly Fe transport n=1 Tax=Siphonobacter aquaeclarae TaxID=563176 RepID=A0A1G9R943_9BACT|nr:TonB-dependent receptor [Siphonobacter aquaeclarae]SDM19640.1 Outer membrane receptor proteins, mostly Fe transport [Siphonobacter aquaeclarae]